MSDEICGEPTADGSPCENPACRTDGKCWMHTETDNRQDPGRDSKLTKERQEAIAAMIEDGHSVTSAARSNGVTKQTVMNWLDRGETQENGIYAEFFDRYTRARGEGEKAYLELVKAMAKEEGDHRFLASLMKTRYPEAWQEADTGVDADRTVIELPESVTNEWQQQPNRNQR